MEEREATGLQAASAVEGQPMLLGQRISRRQVPRYRGDGRRRRDFGCNLPDPSPFHRSLHAGAPRGCPTWPGRGTSASTARRSGCVGPGPEQPGDHSQDPQRHRLDVEMGYHPLRHHGPGTGWASWPTTSRSYGVPFTPLVAAGAETRNEKPRCAPRSSPPAREASSSGLEPFAGYWQGTPQGALIFGAGALRRQPGGTLLPVCGPTTLGQLSRVLSGGVRVFQPGVRAQV